MKRPLQVDTVENVVIKGLFGSDSVIIKLEITPDFVSSHLVWAFIQMKNAVSIKIANKTMRFTKKGAIIVWLDTCTDVEIKVVKILGVPSEGAMGLCVTNSNNIAATSLVIKNMNYGIYCEQTTGFSLKNISLCLEFGVHMHYGKSALLANPTFTGNVQGAIDIYSYSNFMIYSVTYSQSEIGLRIHLSFLIQV